mmetsp:Transcript_2432/g.4550  ORF Transcript_2432/g.4550 Transcript_2432/m.4550 type:complete len:251 (-) Transcript_2432:107-859(-)
MRTTLEESAGDPADEKEETAARVDDEDDEDDENYEIDEDHEASSRHYVFKGRDVLWLEYINFLRQRATKGPNSSRGRFLRDAINLYLTELLSRGAGRVDSSSYLFANRILALFTTQFRNPYQRGSFVANVCNLLPQNGALALHNAEHELECAAEGIGNASTLSHAFYRLANVAVTVPSFLPAWQSLSRVSLCLGRVEQARQFLRTGIEHNPLAAPLISDLVDLEQRYGKVRTAVDLCNDAVDRGILIKVK